ncbi:FAD-dependent oxidoreductase [Agromyces archimandritae]|uniref:D-amino-acid oxidase n=1 Tax=Agromyces archimandritae TaxID=2781962 RepID=A0A975FIZ3_9MICO|nr:FAD-dependent oxidoreductase [Agromyces archimandritae]QTX03363.1 FAD-dependent oxidoreductase [Agromyces archimandritae]
MPRRVTVIGSGVIGLSIAHELAAAGHTVTVRGDAADRVSLLAAAVWFPFEAFPADRVEAWSIAALRRFTELAAEPGTGVRIAPGRILVRDPDTFDDAWRAWVPGIRPMDAAELPAGVAAGLRVELPVIEMPVYLAWLEGRCRRLGVRIEPGLVPGVDAALADADVAVIAAGLASGGLLGGDPELAPIRGQVVRLANPGIDEWTLDEQHADGLAYVIPRSGDVVCGGTATASGDTAVDPATETAILERARGLVPALADAPIVSRAVGLRPGRTEVRLEVVRRAGSSGASGTVSTGAGAAASGVDAAWGSDPAGAAQGISGVDAPGAVIACYGHGGAGVTTSWGCAEEVAALTASIAPV